jgi:acid phosphatase type 7
MASTKNPPTPPDPFPEFPCVEHGLWSPIPTPPPAGLLRLKLKDVAAQEARAVKETGTMSFHTVGCSGDFANLPPGLRVAEAMAAQIAKPHGFGGTAAAAAPSFLFHLGDIVYKADDPKEPLGKDQAVMYNKQFYTQFKGYTPRIFAIAGNHDCKAHPGEKPKKSAMFHFLQNFCATKQKPSPDNQTDDKRPTMVQPYPYWLLETPVAYIIGLFTNDINGGQLDDPMSVAGPQYNWLVKTLQTIKAAADGKALFLALHYPPYSGAGNFAQRGDPNLGPTPRRNPPAGTLQPLGILLQHAFQQTGQYPDVVLSAHAHLYQRLTYTLAGGRQIPYLIVGSGGHVPIENLCVSCWEAKLPVKKPPFDIVMPRGLSLPPGDTVQVVAFNDGETGFLRLTVESKRQRITGEFFALEADSKSTKASLFDSFVLDLKTHTIGGG